MQYTNNLKAGKIDRSLLRGESFELFSAAIRSPATRDPYERKLLGFLKRVNQTPDEFAQFAKENPSAAEKKIIFLLSQDRLKIERGEVTAGTVNNWLKAARLQTPTEYLYQSILQVPQQLFFEVIFLP